MSCSDSPPRAQVRVLTQSHVVRVTFRGGRARGAEVASSRGPTQVASRRGVVLCAGALQTPAILQRSGIGSREDVRRLGITQLAESPAVGGYLQDHPYIAFRVRTPLPCTNLRGSLYAFYSGLKGINGAKALGRRKFELQMLPQCRAEKIELKSFLILLRSRTAGRVVARSMDPAEPPGILWDPFAGNASDAWSLLLGLREIYSLLQAAWPELSFEPSYEAMVEDGFAGQHFAQSLGSWQHPMGTALLGPVLDSRLRVRGVEDLWVADGAALPDWALAGHPDAGIRALGSLVATFAAEDGAAGAYGDPP